MDGEDRAAVWIVVALFVGVPLAAAACIYAYQSDARACAQAHCSYGAHGECDCGGKP